MAVLSQMENGGERQRKRRRLFHLDISRSEPQAAQEAVQERYQMLHRLVPPLYNCYATYADDPDASALLAQRGQICSHLQSITLYPMII